MRKISDKVKRELLKRKQVCQRAMDGGCAGRITWEHAIIYAGKQVDSAWAIVFLCERHHAVNTYQDRGDLNKEKNVWIALNQATNEELKGHSKAVNYLSLKDRLNKKYGDYT